MEPAARSRYHRRPDEGGGGGAEPESSSHVEQEEENEEVPCLLDMYVHHARGIHNICIYANQDVYAKLSLTSAPDHAPPLATRVAAGGGAAPRFDERLPLLRVRRGRLAVDVLKCEVWMRSCAKRLLEDQLLGFALVPLAAVAAAAGARLDRDFELSSTDLFHSPAGTIRLSLALRSGIPGDAAVPPPERGAEPSIASEVVILEPPPPVDYSRIEFDDLKVDQENQAMAVQYLPFLHLGETRRTPETAVEMSTSPRGEKTASSSDGSKNASTTSTVSDDRVISSSAGAAEKPLADEVTMVPMSCRSPDTPTSCSGEKKAGDVFKSPLGDIDIDMEAEQSAMQRQIMEMYVKSMQQFSESLAKVQLPLELDGAVVQKEEKPDSKAIHMQQQQQQQVKKDGPRVFYGSRAFF